MTFCARRLTRQVIKPEQSRHKKKAASLKKFVANFFYVNQTFISVSRDAEGAAWTPPHDTAFEQDVQAVTPLRGGFLCILSLSGQRKYVQFKKGIKIKRAGVRAVAA